MAKTKRSKTGKAWGVPECLCEIASKFGHEVRLTKCKRYHIKKANDRVLIWFNEWID